MTQNSITFERPNPDDADALTDVQIRAFHSDAQAYDVEESGPPGYDSVEQMRADFEAHHVHKIVSAGQIIGGIVVWDRGEGHMHLDKLFIAPEHHNRGIGSLAMQFLERTYPASRWTLDTPQYALRNQHFYEKFGYVKAGEWIEDGTGLVLIAYEKRM